MKTNILKSVAMVATVALLASCQQDEVPPPQPINPDTAEEISVDRFSAAAGHLQVRTATNGLPGPNQPVNFDQGPFITRGLTSNGKPVDYYNFDVQKTTPAPIWAFYKSNGTAVSGQLNVIDVIPGDGGYNDFWQVFKVTVPDDYVANTITSYNELVSKGFSIEKTNMIVNCPVVPKGSTASKRVTNEDRGLTRGWYKGKVVYYFNFSEKQLLATGSGAVPVSPIYVTFNINPGQPGGGPDSEFKAEPGTNPMQTHNVVATVPSNDAYSPLWSVNIYDNAAFGSVNNLATALGAPILAPNEVIVNCPIVFIQP